MWLLLEVIIDQSSKKLRTNIFQLKESKDTLTLLFAEVFSLFQIGKFFYDKDLQSAF